MESDQVQSSGKMKETTDAVFISLALITLFIPSSPIHQAELHTGQAYTRGSPPSQCITQATGGHAPRTCSVPGTVPAPTGEIRGPFLGPTLEEGMGVSIL